MGRSSAYVHFGLLDCPDTLPGAFIFDDIQIVKNLKNLELMTRFSNDYWHGHWLK